MWRDWIFHWAMQSGLSVGLRFTASPCSISCTCSSSMDRPFTVEPAWDELAFQWRLRYFRHVYSQAKDE